MRTIKFLPRIRTFYVMVVVTLLVLLVAIENWRGKRAWDACRREQEEQGMNFDPAAHIPPPVPEDLNFANTPLLAQLFDPAHTNRTLPEKIMKLLQGPNRGTTRTDQQPTAPILTGYQFGQQVDINAWQEYLGTTNLLLLLEEVRPELTEIAEASRRPYARFPVDYDKGMVRPMPHNAALRTLSHLYLLRTVANLRQGHINEAYADVNTLFRLTQSLKNEPCLIPHLTRLKTLSYYIQGVWEGLATHQWSSDQRQTLQEQILQINLLAELKHVLLGDQVLAWNKTFFEIVADPATIFTLTETPLPKFLMPLCKPTFQLIKGIIYHNLVNLNRLYFAMANVINVHAHSIKPGDVAHVAADMETHSFTPHFLMARMNVNLLPRILHATAAHHMFAEQIRLACALDHYRSNKGSYPSSLDQLVPEYIKRLPPDVITGQQMKYRLTNEGDYLLYSVGWNGTDDGGKIARNADHPKRQDLKNGDWVYFSAPGGTNTVAK